MKASTKTKKTEVKKTGKEDNNDISEESDNDETEDDSSEEGKSDSSESSSAGKKKPEVKEGPTKTVNDDSTDPVSKPKSNLDLLLELDDGKLKIRVTGEGYVKQFPHCSLAIYSNILKSIRKYCKKKG